MAMSGLRTTILSKLRSAGYYSPYDPIRDCKITNATGQEFILQGQNLGWCSGDVNVYEGRSAIVRITQASGLTRDITLEQPRVEIESSGNNPFYQWGRKDPIPAAVNQNGSIVNKTLYDKDGAPLAMPFQTSSTRYTIGQTIQNPNTFVCSGNFSNWIAAASDGAAVNYCNLWNAQLTGSSGITFNNGIPVFGTGYRSAKTIYDPCPRGYRVPDPDVFTGTTVNGGRIPNRWEATPNSALFTTRPLRITPDPDPSTAGCSMPIPCQGAEHTIPREEYTT